jgi:MoxR-like ATPase
VRYIEFTPDHVEKLPAYAALPETVHVFDDDTIEAVNAALAARRPLLVRGEPGTGKSQLARAAAAALGRAFLPFTVDARTEARDLLFTVDTVARLADAQILGHLPAEEGLDVQARLAEERYTEPGPLWWVFDWTSATHQIGDGRGKAPWTPESWQPDDGAVLLVDEIDKSDPAMPNGLLEALGQGQFQAPGATTVVASQDAVAPLVIVTTNEERALPDAFVRRCLVLRLHWPDDEEALLAALVARGRAHFKDVDEDVLLAAAKMVAADRAEVARRGLCPPGGAEYLDLLRVVATRFAGDADAQRVALERIRGFALRKHPEAPDW